MQIVDQLLSTMTLDEKIGQLFLLAFSKNRFDEARILFEEYFVGSSYIAQENVPTPETAVELTAALQRYAANTRLKIPVMLGVDQEGAWGVMVPHSSTGPGNMALGASGRPDDAYRMYEVIGRELRAVGLHAVFGPCADCNSNPYNSIIGMRAFGEKPGLVGTLAAASVRGAHAGGVIATAKHFPGHGDTTTDTHRGLAMVNRSLSELHEIDLYPFAQCIKAGVDMVMTSHILFPAIDPDHPATLSSAILQGILRAEMGFDGVIVTDSMNMQAMVKNYPPEQSAILALKAGADLIMLAEEHYNHDAATYIRNQTAIIRAVGRAVRDGSLPLARLDDAVRRVLTLKQKFALWPGVSLAPTDAEQVGVPAHRQVELDISRHAVAVLRDALHLVPIASSTALTLVNTTPRASYDILTRTRGIGQNQTRAAFDYFVDAMRATFADINLVSAEEFSIDTLPTGGLIVAVTENYPLPGVDFDQSNQPDVIHRLHAADGDRLIVVALRDPYELTALPLVKTYVCAFSFRPSSAQAAVDVLSGKVAAMGQTPVTVPGTEFIARAGVI